MSALVCPAPFCLRPYVGFRVSWSKEVQNVIRWNKNPCCFLLSQVLLGPFTYLWVSCCLLNTLTKDWKQRNNFPIVLFASICFVLHLATLCLITLTDTAVFIGAQSNVGQTSWFWENGTMVNDPRYPPSNQSVCQEMAIPLGYDDGVSLLPKRCDHGEAYFACEIPSKTSLFVFCTYIRIMHTAKLI